MEPTRSSHGTRVSPRQSCHHHPRPAPPDTLRRGGLSGCGRQQTGSAADSERGGLPGKKSNHRSGNGPCGPVPATRRRNTRRTARVARWIDDPSVPNRPPPRTIAPPCPRLAREMAAPLGSQANLPLVPDRPELAQVISMRDQVHTGEISFAALRSTGGTCTVEHELRPAGPRAGALARNRATATST